MDKARRREVPPREERAEGLSSPKDCALGMDGQVLPFH